MDFFETIHKDYKRAEACYKADNDEATPFKTKYEAKEILFELISKIEDQNDILEEFIIAKEEKKIFLKRDTKNIIAKS